MGLDLRRAGAQGKGVEFDALNDGADLTELAELAELAELRNEN
jgi:hypothetical protein